jgi:uncharacterized repeat protein (TIGR02543 family)
LFAPAGCDNLLERPESGDSGLERELDNQENPGSTEKSVGPDQSANADDPVQYTITFESNEGSTVEPVTADAGTAVEQPAEPERQGYTFTGWFNVASGGALYVWPYTLTADVTMYAQWRDSAQAAPVQYTLVFNAGEGAANPPASQTVDLGTAVTLPEQGTMTAPAGKIFAGWNDGNQDYQPGDSYTVNADMVLTALWKGGLTSMSAVTAYLEESKGGKTAKNPVPLAVELDLATNWGGLLTAIQSSGKYVTLDLSVCTMTGNVFDPDTPYPAPALRAESKIVSLVLPDATESIKAGSSSSSTFRLFTGLTSVSGKNIETVDAYAFQNCTTLVTADFPKAVTIGEYAFAGCRKLETLNLPEALTIEQHAFSECRNLVTAELSKVVTIGNYAFQDAFKDGLWRTSLVTLNLPELTTTGINTFGSCTALETVNLPKAVTIGQYTFHECSSLKTMSLPKATSIGFTAFAGCTSLTIVDIPEAASVSMHAFMRCTSLETVNIPKAESIGQHAFSECAALKTANFPKVTSIGQNAFYGCASLETVNLPKAAKIANAVFANCTSLTTVSLPEAADIGVSAFQGCTALAAAYLPKLEMGPLDRGIFEKTASPFTLTLGSTAPTPGYFDFGAGQTVTVQFPVGGTGYGTDWETELKRLNPSPTFVFETY